MEKIFIFIILIFLGCKNKRKIDKSDTIEIISTLFDYSTTLRTKMMAFPPPRYNPNIAFDSLIKNLENDRKIPKDTIKITNNIIQKYGRLIVGIDTFLRKEDFKKHKKFRRYI